jgi:putative endopeptidase
MTKGFSGIDLKNIDKTVRPQDDFFNYAIGGWLKKNPIPPAEARWGSFYVLREQSAEQLHTVVKEVENKKNAAPFSNEQLVRDLWKSGMDEKTREKRGFTPLNPFFEKIAALKSAEDVIDFIAEMHKVGVSVFWGTYVGQDDKRSERNILHIVQSGLSLPDRDYYVKDDPESKKIRAAYLEHMQKMLRLSGKSAAEAKRYSEVVMRIETSLAESSMTQVERRDIEKQYNKRTLSELEKNAPNVDWQRYFKKVGTPSFKELILAQPLFAKKVSDLLKSAPLEEIKMYLYWQVVDDGAPYLNKAAVKEHFHFYGTVLSGVTKMKPLWRRIVNVVDGGVGDALGKLYVEKYFNAEAKKKIDRLVDDLFEAYEARIKRLDWMSPETKKKALLKLHKIERKLAHPKKWRSYKGLVIRPNEYFENLVRVSEYETKRMFRKLNQKPDRQEWHMTPATVNAYFNFNMNEIVFPAGIMQPPFFDPKLDDAVNYGGIGSVIGHELTHGFDDQGSQFDGKGNFREWWKKSDKEKFTKKAAVLVKQYDQFVAIDDIHVNGKLTLGENIADLGGIIIAYEAMQKAYSRKKSKEKIQGLTPEQRFFLGYAITECMHGRPEALKRQLVTDPHSPSIFRVNGPLSNLPEFYEAFDVKKGDKLYRDPKTHAKIW